jgi:hypothetical protein
MRCIPVLIFCAVVIGAVLCTGCINTPDPVYQPDVSTTEMRVHYERPLRADYGTGDCFIKQNLSGETVIKLRSGHCLMQYARFGRLANDTEPHVLKVDLVRDGQVIKSYSSGTDGVSFDKVGEFLTLLTKDPGLVQQTPLSAKIIADGKWGASITDMYGAQYEQQSGPATLTFVQPVPPVKACVRSISDTAGGTPPVVELYSGNTFLKRSNNTKNTYNEYCVTYP